MATDKGGESEHNIHVSYEYMLPWLILPPVVG